MVTKDMTQYTHVLKSWEIGHQQPTSAMLDVLLEVANLFVIGPEALRERIRTKASTSSSSTTSSANGNGGKTTKSGNDDDNPGLTVQELKAYVSRREDCNSPGMQSVLTSL